MWSFKIRSPTVLILFFFFYDLVLRFFSLVIVLIEKIQSSSWKKNTARQSIFNSLLHVWKCSQTFHISFAENCWNFQIFWLKWWFQLPFGYKWHHYQNSLKKYEIVVSPEHGAKTIKQSLVACSFLLEECYEATIMMYYRAFCLSPVISFKQ